MYSTKTFIIPVNLISILYNVPKFFELTVTEVVTVALANGTIIPINETLLNDTNLFNDNSSNTIQTTLMLRPTDLRTNPIYIRVYILWMNLIVNIVGPFIVLATLNFMVKCFFSIISFFTG